MSGEVIMIENLNYNSRGLIPAIIQDIESKEVLMLGYMNLEALKKTIKTKRTWFYSRSRQRLWNKGETSGNYHIVKTIKYDCDKDALLVQVLTNGPTCHKGNNTCFSDVLLEGNIISGKEIIDFLYMRIMEKRELKSPNSYTNYLFREGIDKILKKIGEEASEVIIASKNNSKEEIKYEICDLIYHLMVLMVDRDINIHDIRGELLKRYNKG